MAPLKVETPGDLWPTFTDAQVSFLEALYRPRCLGPTEMVEAHLRYAGKVDLIAQLREHVPGSPAALHFSDDEEEALDTMAEELAQEQQPQE